jgi:hypothetical protein
MYKDIHSYLLHVKEPYLKQVWRNWLTYVRKVRCHCIITAFYNVQCISQLRLWLKFIVQLLALYGWRPRKLLMRNFCGLIS